MQLNPICFLKTVAVAGTQERLTTNNLKVSAVMIQAEPTNTNYVYVGDSTVSSTNYGIVLAAGDLITLNAQLLGMGYALISLKDIWLDVDTNTEGVSCIYLVEK